MDPVAALQGGKRAVALRLAAAHHIANILRPVPPKYADGMPEA